MSSLLRKKFSSSKCKTLLQLTSQRLKVLRNRQAINAKKARADVARLLERGQDSNAKMQVEVVFREQKIVAVYELLDQFCQLLISRLESIKSQKECPFDLKEAVASLLFAAPRCAELVELQQVSKQFTSKYGTEFSVAAKELRPDCGVNKQVIQSLSTRSPDFNERLRLLKEIAVENNVKWDDEAASADNQWGTDLLDGLDHFANTTKLSEASSFAVPDNSRSLQRNQVKEQRQFPPITINTEAMRAERALKLTVDPYALARSQGKMDYKVVSDYIDRPESSAGHLKSMELKQESRNRYPYGESAAELAEQEPGYHNAFSDASSHEDAPQRMKGKKAEKRRDVMDFDRRNGEDELSQLTDVAEYAVVAAANAAEAARATVDFVRMDSSERFRGSKGVGTNKLQELKPESSSAPVRDEKYKLDMDSTVDGSEDTFKYVVFEQTSATQRETKRSTKVEESNTDAELYAFPTPSAHKRLDRIIFDAEHDGLGSEDVSENAFFEGSYVDPMKGRELHKRASLSNNQERISQQADIQQDKHVQNNVSVPQFDDYYEEVDNRMQKEASVPESDDSSSEDHDYMEKGASMPQFDDHVHDEDGEEEVPFYLRGRAAMHMDEYDMCTNEYDSRHARNPTNMVVLAGSSSHYDDDVEDNVVLNMQNSEKVARLHLDSNAKEKPLITEKRWAHHDLEAPSQWSSFDDCGEPVSLPPQPQSSKEKVAGSRPVNPDTACRLQISTDYAADSSKMNPISYTNDFGKPITPQRLKWCSRVFEEWESDANHANMGPLASSELSYHNGSGSPSSQVNRKLSWFSGASDDSESMSERSFESHKQRLNPSSLEDLNLESPRHPLDTGDFTRASTINPTKAAQPSPQKSYVGMSKRSVRSTRTRQG